MKEQVSDLCTGGAQNATLCKFHSYSTVEIGEMYYSVGWLLKILSTSQVIMLEDDQLWLLHLQKLPVYIVRKVVLRSHCQHASRKSYYPDSKKTIAMTSTSDY